MYEKICEKLDDIEKDGNSLHFSHGKLNNPNAKKLQVDAIDF